MFSLDWDIEIIRNSNTLSWQEDLLESFQISSPVTDSVGSFEMIIYNDPEQDIKEGDIVRIKVKNEETSFTKLLEGEILEAEKTEEEEEVFLKLKGKEWATWLLYRKVASKEYTDVQANSIVLDLVDELVTDGLLTTLNVESCTILLTKTFYEQTIFDAVKDVCDLVEYDFYVDPDKDLHFFARGSKSSGKTLTKDDLDSFRYFDSYRNIINEIEVYGAPLKREPSDMDSYTDSLTNWTLTEGSTLVLDTTAKAGTVSIKTQVIFEIGGGAVANRTFNTIDLSSFDSFRKMKFFLYIGAVEYPQDIFIKLYAPDSDNLFKRRIDNVILNEWMEITFNVGPDYETEGEWELDGGSPSWATVAGIEVFVSWADPGVSDHWKVDKLYFDEGRFYSKKTDSASQTSYKKRTIPAIVDETLTTQAEVDKVAEAKLEEYKDPLPTLENIQTIEGYETLKPGEKITIELPENTLTKRLINIEHILKEGDYFNKLELSEASPTLSSELEALGKELSAFEYRREER